MLIYLIKSRLIFFVISLVKILTLCIIIENPYFQCYLLIHSKFNTKNLSTQQ